MTTDELADRITDIFKRRHLGMSHPLTLQTVMTEFINADEAEAAVRAAEKKGFITERRTTGGTFYLTEAGLNNF